MEVGYEPSRIHELSRRTQEAVDRLGGLTSSDPAAANAIRTLRLTRANLEDHWMPALREIERSDTMLRWRASRLSASGSLPLNVLSGSLPDHLRPGGAGAVAMPAKRRDQLLRRLDFFDRKAKSGDAALREGTAPVGAPTDGELADLGRQLALWVRHSDQFAHELVELSVSNLLVGRLLAEASFPASFAGDVARRMAVPNGPDSHVDHDRYALSLSTALASLTDDSAACLDLLLDQPTAYALASWDAPDTAIVSEFAVSGLYGAVDADPDRLADGYSVLRFLTRATNGPLDGGMSAGMALGIAASLPGYLDTLAPAIEQEGATPVVIRAVSPSIELGTYDDLVDLFGAVIRSPEAQPAIGTALAAYTFETFERVAGDATRRPDVSHLADFADLIGDASSAEQAELVITAAIDEARHRHLDGLIGFGTNVALLAGGAGSVARSIAGRAVQAATRWRDDGEPHRLPEGRIPAQAYDLITVAAVSVPASNPSMRHDAGLDDVTATEWAEVTRHVDVIEQLDDPHSRMLAVGDLDHWIDTSVPALAAYLLELRKMPGVSELKERRAAAGAD